MGLPRRSARSRREGADFGGMPGTDIEDASIGAVIHRDQQIGPGDILDINQIARLVTVLKHNRGQIVHQSGAENGDDARVRIEERLARTECT